MRRLPILLAVGALGLFSAAQAQATWVVQTLIPDVIAIRTPSTNIGFKLGDDYPPKTLPAQYPATEPNGGVFPVQVFSNAAGVWNLLLQVPDLRDAAGTVLVPARQVLYRVNGGLWLRADGTPQIIYTQAGPTSAWLEIRLEFALEIVGTERSGNYLVQALVTALRQ